MEKEKKFVSKIINDAKIKKEQIKDEAKLEATNFLKEQEKQEKAFFNEEKKALKKEFEKTLENEKSTSYLEQGKIVLEAKHEILDDIFDLALQKMKKISAKDYQTFLQNVLTQNAETNDGLIISSKKGEEERIKKLAVFKKKKLKILKQSKDISGGVIIVSDIYEKDFSFEGLIEERAQTMSHTVAKELF